MIQLFFTAAFITFVHLVPGVATFYLLNFWLFIVSVIISVVSMIVIYCTSQGKKHPNNLIWLSIFTAAEAYSLGFVGVMQANIVVPAALITLAVVVALFIYAFLAKTDFTMMMGALFVFGTIVLVGSVIQIFYKNDTFQMIMACAGALMFGLYIIFDVQMMVGGKGYEYDIDDYVIASVNLYVDIIGLFLKILEIMGIFSKK